MNKESPKRWAANGLPRKGWTIIDYVDTEDCSERCVWCGTEIRYVFSLIHSESGLETTSGCVCAEHLSEDYINPKLMQKALIKRRNQKKSKILKFSKNWRISQNGNLYKKIGDDFVTIFKTKNGNNFRWAFKGIFSDRNFPEFNDALLHFFDLFLDKK